MKDKETAEGENIPWNRCRHELTAVSVHGIQRNNTSAVELPAKQGLHETERKLVSPPPRYSLDIASNFNNSGPNG